MLRVEKAKPSFRERLTVDWESEEERARDAAQAAAEGRSALPELPPLSDKPVRVMRPDRKKVRIRLRSPVQHHAV